MNQRAYFYLLLTTFFWGGNAIAGKLAVGIISPMLLTSFRWGLAVCLLIGFALPQIRRDWPMIRRYWLRLAVFGAVGFTIFNVCLYSALQFTTAINVVIEQAGMPVIIFVINFVLFRIAATMGQVVGFCITLIGVLMVASAGQVENLLTLTLNRGDVIMLFAIVIYGGYTVALRFMPPMHWQSAIAVMALSAFLASLPFSAWEFAAERTIWPDWRGLAIALYTAIFPSIIAQVLYIKGNALIGANRAGLFINLVPIFGTLLSVIILGEELHIYHMIALLLVLGGIAMAERTKQPEKIGPAP